MTFFVYQQFALSTLETLAAQSPNSVMTKRAESSTVEAFGLEKNIYFLDVITQQDYTDIKDKNISENQ